MSAWEKPEGASASISSFQLHLGVWLGYRLAGATSLAFLDYSWVRWILTVLALGELVTDQLQSLLRD
jgi:uncharacterized membrane protein